MDEIAHKRLLTVTRAAELLRAEIGQAAPSQVPDSERTRLEDEQRPRHDDQWSH